MDPVVTALITTLLTSPLVAAALITAISLLVAMWVPGRLRKLGFQPGRKDGELDWAGMIGLVLALCGLLMGMSGSSVIGGA